MMQYHIFYFEKNPEASYIGCKTNTFLSLDRFQGDKQLKDHNIYDEIIYISIIFVTTFVRTLPNQLYII